MPRESFSYWTRQYKRYYCKCVRLYECSVFFFYSRIHPPLRFTSVRCASLTCCVRKEHTKPNWLSKRENSEEEEKSLFFLHFLYIQYFFRWFHSLLRGSFVSFTSLVLYFSFFLINSVSVWFAMVHCIARLGYVIRYIWSNKKKWFSCCWSSAKRPQIYAICRFSFSKYFVAFCCACFPPPRQQIKKKSEKNGQDLIVYSLGFNCDICHFIGFDFDF